MLVDLRLFIDKDWQATNGEGSSEEKKKKFESYDYERMKGDLHGVLYQSYRTSTYFSDFIKPDGHIIRAPVKYFSSTNCRTGSEEVRSARK